MARAPKKKKVAEPPTPRKPRAKMEISGEALGRSRRKRPVALGEVYRAAEFPPGVGDGSLKLAMDSALTDSSSWANQVTSAFSFIEGQQFLGYPNLALMAQRPEYRRMVERTAQEMVRKWIEFESKGDDDKSDKIQKVDAEFKRLGIKDAFQEAAELDGFFGRGHLFLGFGDAEEDDDELALPIGDGMNALSQSKVSPERPLRRVKCVEPMWTYPLEYNTLDPLHPQWYLPSKWQVYSRTVHASRILTFVGREVPDMLKPVYGFGGLSLTQMAKPYVDNWLRTRQSVSDLVASFSQFVLMTNAAEALMQGGEKLFNRVDFFNQMRDNRGTFVLDKETEDLKNIQVSLATLDKLQAQSQEHISSICGLPLVVFLGIQPAGLNATSDGELEVFASWINAYQESLFREPLTIIFHFVQLSLFGSVDPSLTFKFVPLREVSEEEAAKIRETDARTGKTLVEGGVITPAEERQRVMGDEGSGYASLEGKVAPLPPIAIATQAAANGVSAIMAVHEGGLISDMTALKELQALNLKVGLFGKIDENVVAQADHEPPGGAGGQPDMPAFPPIGQQTPVDKSKADWFGGASDAAWEENKHPRGQVKNRGQFKSKTKDIPIHVREDGELSDKERAKLVEAQTKAVLDIAKRENFPLDKLTITDVKDFPPTHEALSGTEGTLEGFTNNQTNEITVLVGHPKSDPSHVAGVMMHELQHIKMNAVFDAFHNERVRLANSDADVKTAGDIDGKEYPILKELSPFLLSELGTHFLVNDDGVTPYSHDVWQNFIANQTPHNFLQGIHETVAEMARVKYELQHGRLDPLLWRPPSSVWLDFSEALDKCWKKINDRR